MCVSEHWLYKNQLNRFDDISCAVTYVCHASKRAPAEMFGCGCGQGGVGILWDRSVGGITPIHDILHDRICGIRLQNTNGAIINIFAVYMPASNSDDDLSTVLDELSVILEGREPESLNMVCGDLNGDVGNAGGPRGRKGPTNAGKLVNNFCQRHGLVASNMLSGASGPLHTYQGPFGESTLDYILVPMTLQREVVDSGVSPDHVLNTSDHLPVFAKLELGELPILCVDDARASAIKWAKLTEDILYEKYTKQVDADMRVLLESLHSAPVDVSGIDKILSKVTHVLHNAARNLPRAKYRKHLKPFWCKELDVLKKAKITTYRKWVEMGRPRDSDNPVRCDYIKGKKQFIKRLYALAREV